MPGGFAGQRLATLAWEPNWGANGPHEPLTWPKTSSIVFAARGGFGVLGWLVVAGRRGSVCAGRVFCRWVLRLLTLISATDLVPVYASVAVAVAAADDGAVTVSGGPRV